MSAAWTEAKCDPLFNQLFIICRLVSGAWGLRPVINEPVSQLFCILSGEELLSLAVSPIRRPTGELSSSQAKQSGHSFTRQRHPKVSGLSISSGLNKYLGEATHREEQRTKVMGTTTESLETAAAILNMYNGACGSVVIKVLHYKSEGCGFETALGKTKLRGLSPWANYTGRATEACRKS
jgi:hypothetical protein